MSVWDERSGHLSQDEIVGSVVVEPIRSRSVLDLVVDLPCEIGVVPVIEMQHRRHELLFRVLEKVDTIDGADTWSDNTRYFVCAESHSVVNIERSKVGHDDCCIVTSYFLSKKHFNFFL